MNNPTVVIVEDDPDVAELYRRVVQTSGFTAEILKTGEAALARLAATVPEIVLLDLNLPPRVSGREVLQHIRADARLAAVRVIVVTGHPELADTVREQADLVLLKPVDVNQISDFVTRLQPGR
jgi:DNA-binding response OmpR family regulator